MEAPRDRRSRAAAERALVRLVTAYGRVPDFVLLGGLVPDLLCAGTPRQHIGTTDVDLQLNLEINAGSQNAAHLESALLTAGFRADAERVWRWHDSFDPKAIVRVEFLADLDHVPANATVLFEECDRLGAANLRGTGFAAVDNEILRLTAETAGQQTTVAVRVARLAGYLLAKIHAAYGRRAPKDWYDIAFVLLHTPGGPTAAGAAVGELLASQRASATGSALDDLAANFADESAQGPTAFAEAMLRLYPELDWDTLTADAVTAVSMFLRLLGSRTQAAGRSGSGRRRSAGSTSTGGGKGAFGS
jgi:hypothetical protein